MYMFSIFLITFPLASSHCKVIFFFFRTRPESSRALVSDFMISIKALGNVHEDCNIKLE